MVAEIRPTEVMKNEDQGYSLARRLLVRCWDWARKVLEERERQVYMAPNFKMDE